MTLAATCTGLAAPASPPEVVTGDAWALGEAAAAGAEAGRGLFAFEDELTTGGAGAMG